MAALIALSVGLVAIDVPNQVNLCHRGRNLTVSRFAVRAHLEHGDAIGQCF